MYALCGGPHPGTVYKAVPSQPVPVCEIRLSIIKSSSNHLLPLSFKYAFKRKDKHPFDGSFGKARCFVGPGQAQVSGLLPLLVLVTEFVIKHVHVAGGVAGLSQHGLTRGPLTAAVAAAGRGRGAGP